MNLFRRSRPVRRDETPEPTQPLPVASPLGFGNRRGVDPSCTGGSSPAPFDWATIKDARRDMQLPADPLEADDLELRDLIEQATARTVQHPARQWAWPPDGPLPPTGGAA